VTTIEAPPPAWRAYRVFGLGVRSQIALPDLAPDAVGEVDVTIRLEPARSGARRAPSIVFAPEEVRLDFPAARYRVLGGREIAVEPAQGASEREIRLHLLGPVMNALCLRRDLTLLHAAAVEVAGAAMAFVGPSGAGKSTLAAALHHRGWPLICDDVCPVGFDAAGLPRTWSGPRRIKLARESLSALGRTADAADPVADRLDKFSFPATAGAPCAVSLTRIYLLRRVANTGDEAITRLAGARAVDAILTNIHHWTWVVQMGRARGVFEACAALARCCEVFAVDRCWNLGGLASQARTVEAHMTA